MTETATVALHGFTGSAAAMAPLTGRLPGPVLALDLPGHGPGPVSDNPADYTMAAAVAGVVSAAAHLERFALVGYSMGGRVALQVALAHPEQVTALALIGARAGIDDPEERAERIAADEALADRIESEGIEWFADFWADRPLFATQRQRLSVEQRYELRAQRLACDPRGLAHSLRGIGAGAVDPIGCRLGDLSMPCALVVGEDDTKFAAIAHHMAAAIPQADVCLIPDAGHATHIEAPDATAAAVIQCVSN
ncbi:MAG: 2-succinyl-6-hydroxy-2,4-cyclohexadiene-1-carboxylate synthase [Acidimicrobiia bacterium]|nr:2-succinyl-6-hydroxy-2,4-cyclohexadiene-1-carboxylate synthase [Acidimicrobiia bacterium]MCY4435257.1 2-succinyl-6-hydroxy-2,4-cyclohexadiene-1-carboxylate synthase [bacterium]